MNLRIFNLVFASRHGKFSIELPISLSLHWVLSIISTLFVELQVIHTTQSILTFPYEDSGSSTCTYIQPWQFAKLMTSTILNALTKECPGRRWNTLYDNKNVEQFTTSTYENWIQFPTALPCWLDSCCRSYIWSIPAMVDFHSLFSSSKARLPACSSIPVKSSHFHCFVNYWICLRNQHLDWKDFLRLCIRFFLEPVQCFQNLANQWKQSHISLGQSDFWIDFKSKILQKTNPVFY